ncbi:Cysteine synthase A [Klebsiella quasipneumoniae subsp. similipneumoniae]|nr:Cysteine synthase A [Klebsiella quasipneumoniae subsp. similipneumoniae]
MSGAGDVSLAATIFGVAAALKLQEDEAFTNKTIVVILPSSGERYLSTALFADLFTEKELQQ